MALAAGMAAEWPPASGLCFGWPVGPADKREQHDPARPRARARAAGRPGGQTAGVAAAVGSGRRCGAEGRGERSIGGQSFHSGPASFWRKTGSHSQAGRPLPAEFIWGLARPTGGGGGGGDECGREARGERMGGINCCGFGGAVTGGKRTRLRHPDGVANGLGQVG